MAKPDEHAAPLIDDAHRIAASAMQCWASSGYAALTHIDCCCRQGVLFIFGVVPSYYFKQMAQESIRVVEGIDKIVNQLTVQAKDQASENRQHDTHNSSD